MHKKFKINRTKIKFGCQSGRKVVSHNSESDLPLQSYGLLLQATNGQGHQGYTGVPVLHSGSHFHHGLLQLMIHTIDPMTDGKNFLTASPAQGPKHYYVVGVLDVQTIYFLTIKRGYCEPRRCKLGCKNQGVNTRV